MKNMKQLILTAGIVLGIGIVFSAEARAADRVAEVKQTAGSRSSVEVQCSASAGAEYYYMEISADNQKWTLADVSSSPDSLSSSSLLPGKSYYVRVGVCADSAGVQRTDGTLSDAVEVVTAPSGSVDAVQTGAKEDGFSVKLTGDATSGANYYMLSADETIVGTGSSNIVNTTVKLKSGSLYRCCYYACRRSESGYIAIGNYGFARYKTLPPTLSANDFGLLNADISVDSFVFIAGSQYEKDGVHYQFATPKGKVKKNVYTTASGIGLNNFICGNFYKYRVRTYVQCSTGRVYSKWSGYKYVGVPKKLKSGYSWDNKSKKLKLKSVTIKFSKVKDATSYIVYASLKEKSGYRKVKTVSAKEKRSVVVQKIGGKKIRKGKEYYFKVVPVVKIKKKTYKSSVGAGQSWRMEHNGWSVINNWAS